MILVLFIGQSTFASKDGAFSKAAKKKGDYVFDDTDFLGLDFFEKKRYQGLPPGGGAWTRGGAWNWRGWSQSGAETTKEKNQKWGK
jgi:hypothetical protein